MDSTIDLTPTEVIEHVRAVRETQRRAAVEEIELALAWAALHPCPSGEVPAHWGDVDLHGSTCTASP